MADKLTRIDNVCTCTGHIRGGEAGCRESPGACVYRFIHYTGLFVGGTAASKQRGSGVEGGEDPRRA